MYAHIAQSRQSAKLFLQSSDSDSPTPSHASECVPTGGGGGTLARGREKGWEGPIPTRGQTVWYSVYMYFVGTWNGGREIPSSALISKLEGAQESI